MITYEITEDNKILASNIKRCRTKLKESQFDFAENCGISVEILSLIERGIANPKLSTLQKLAAYLGCTVADLFEK